MAYSDPNFGSPMQSNAMRGPHNIHSFITHSLMPDDIGAIPPQGCTSSIHVDHWRAGVHDLNHSRADARVGERAETTASTDRRVSQSFLEGGRRAIFETRQCRKEYSHSSSTNAKPESRREDLFQARRPQGSMGQGRFIQALSRERRFPCYGASRFGDDEAPLS